MMVEKYVFDPELQMEKIEEWDGSPIEITIPATMVGSPWDGIIVNLKDKYGGTDERKFPLVGSENGIQIGDTDRSRDVDHNNVECEMAIAPDAEDEHGNSRFSKDRGMAIFYENCVTLGYNDGVETTILDEDDLKNLKIVDAAGNEVSSSVAKIEMYSYFWYYDEDQKKDIYFQSHDVFAIRIYKTGSYRLAYEKPIGQDNVEVTMAAINANLGDISIYSKPVADEKVIVGGDNTTYGDDRRTFYIVPYEEFSNEYKRVIEIVSKVKANSSEAKVEILNGTNIIKVTVDEDATDDIGVQVSYKQTESWYHEEEDEWVLDENPDDDGFENPRVHEFNRYFMFNASGVVIPDSETLVSDKYQASLFDGMVKELPDADKFTANDMEKYESVCESYNALTLLQREFVKAETLDKLERIDSSILQALTEKNELSNMLKPLLEKETVDLDDKDAVEEIYNKYNELTDAQKTFVDAFDANAIKICKTVIDSIISTKDRVSSIIDFEFDKKYDECRG